ncbi:XrtA/PEP-CTERM system exopolysaccharide export protein [Vreelandella utahensis]|uniref:XrtA/PEP-CTERM system exopolysaccharide export protein n=1 Tax=Vreelandella halophila TaxID=86177 RepID=UPI00098481EB|nr:XrtA/PEP-CTERM system exopolysaccharide export protein [Halomonas utahensis]
MMRQTVGAGLLLMVFLLIAGCSGSPYSSENRIQKALERETEPVEQYRIGPSDTLRIVVWRNEDLSVQVPVRPDGRISVPLAGDVSASGETPEDLAAKIEEGLDTYIRQPEVSVIVTQMGSHEFSHRVRVTGAVSQPSSQPYHQGMTVMDVVLGAGGLNEFANGDAATLYRQLDGNVVAIPLDLDAILNDGDISTNHRLVPGDIITIPERRF